MAKLKVQIEIQDAYDTQEAAAILMVGIATIWRWVANGKLATFKLAGRTLIAKSELERVKGLQMERAPQTEGALGNKER